MPFEFGTHFPFTWLRSLGSEIVELFDSSSLIVAGARSVWPKLHQDAYFLLNVFGWHKDWNFFWCDTIPTPTNNQKNYYQCHFTNSNWDGEDEIYISHVECDLFFAMWLYGRIYEIFFHYDQSSCDLITHLNTHIQNLEVQAVCVFYIHISPGYTL